ncbi:MAG TPA: YjhX family toxin [Caulobacteraceae bacterium]|nr:YjhX family toxin [Caulobacteraceae bacterium]
MNISRAEQRTLHALAQGGRIVLEKDQRGDPVGVDCFTRDGWRLADCTLPVWRKLRRRRLILSRDGGPYFITRDGLEALRPQLDNRVSARRW